MEDEFLVFVFVFCIVSLLIFVCFVLSSSSSSLRGGYFNNPTWNYFGMLGRSGWGGGGGVELLKEKGSNRKANSGIARGSRDSDFTRLRIHPHSMGLFPDSLDPQTCAMTCINKESKSPKFVR